MDLVPSGGKGVVEVIVVGGGSGGTGRGGSLSTGGGVSGREAPSSATSILSRDLAWRDV